VSAALKVSIDGGPYALAAGSGPYGITAGADGALWFTAMTSGDLGRISVDGELSG